MGRDRVCARHPWVGDHCFQSKNESNVDDAVVRFFGIIIRMYFDEHLPPHFHAIYAGREVQVGIDPIQVLEGKLSRRAVSMVIEWAALHQRELMTNWDRLRRNQSVAQIEPLE